MTIKNAFRLLPALLLLFPFLSTGCDRVVEPELEPEAGQFIITSRQVPVSETTLEGTFEAQGAIGDRGTVQEVLDSTEPLHERGSIYGVKTLVGTKGTITIEFYASLKNVNQTSLQASGGFRIVRGTEAYEGLQGNGEIDLEIPADASPGAITRVLEGEAVYTP